MPVPLSRRTFAATLAAGAALAGDDAGEPRPPVEAPKPPLPKDLWERAGLLFEALLGEFPETRLEARRAEVTRQIAVNLYHGRVLRSAGLSNADGPGPLWAAWRADESTGKGD